MGFWDSQYRTVSSLAAVVGSIEAVQIALQHNIFITFTSYANLEVKVLKLAGVTQILKHQSRYAVNIVCNVRRHSCTGRQNDQDLPRLKSRDIRKPLCLIEESKLPTFPSQYHHWCYQLIGAMHGQGKTANLVEGDAENARAA